jgi:hypothetical protein
MCGSFALYTEPVKVAGFLQATPEDVKDEWQPSWNIPPTERIVGARERVVDNGEITRTLGLYRWGLVPFWAKDPSVGNRAFNARAETVATQPMFGHAFTTRKRILIPADAFYEWKKTGGPKRALRLPTHRMAASRNRSICGSSLRGRRRRRMTGLAAKRIWNVSSIGGSDGLEYALRRNPATCGALRTIGSRLSEPAQLISQSARCQPEAGRLIGRKDLILNRTNQPWLHASSTDIGARPSYWRGNCRHLKGTKTLEINIAGRTAQSSPPGFRALPARFGEVLAG